MDYLYFRHKPDYQFAEDDERSWMAGFQSERFSQNLVMAEKLKRRQRR